MTTPTPTPLTYTPLRVACVGGGQLGRMLALESPRLNISMTFLDPSGPSSPAALAVGSSNVVAGSLHSSDALRSLVSRAAGDGGDETTTTTTTCDVVTVEIEHVGTDALQMLEDEGVNVQPSPRVIRLIQDKLTQKEHFASRKVPVAPFLSIASSEALKDAATSLGLPLMLKSRKGAYDGRGNAVLERYDVSSVSAALSSLGVTGNDGWDLYAEGWIDFRCEIAVMVVRGTTGEMATYPPVLAVQKDSICHVTVVPPPGVSDAEKERCTAVARDAVAALGEGATGVFGVELFLTKTGEVLLNEVAPRPHNTGHYTQDACVVSQFENHLRAICGMKLGETGLTVGAAAMVNLLGSPTTMNTVNTALTLPRCSLHWYSKQHRPGRKLGHINLTASSPAELQSTISHLLTLENSTATTNLSSPQPLVSVIMGSDSDLPTMQAAVQILHQFDIPTEVDIVSAHRTPDKLLQYGKTASSRGIQVIIAGAGGAAHLPGMMAAATPLPVIGVPIKTSTLNGRDSLLSIVQMPRGIPVATVAIGNAMNAGLLAVRILGATREGLRERMVRYQEEMREVVEGKSGRLLEVGSEVYLEGMKDKSKEVNV